MNSKIKMKNKKIILIFLDPIYGKVVWSADKFLQNWASLDNRAVVVY